MTENKNMYPYFPKCNIIDKLIEKSSDPTNKIYIKRFDDLREKVSLEVSRINELFPEYTPHDEKYHLNKLFFIADDLLGEDLIASMNVTELYLLAVALYAHDWGMAVSDN